MVPIPGRPCRHGARIKALLARRIATQPLALPNAGSVFRNPGDHAARLIEACGLKDTGSAARTCRRCTRISSSIRNAARAADIEQLIAHVRAVVEAKTGVALEAEVRLLGEPARDADAGAEQMATERQSMEPASDDFGKVAVLLGGPSAEREISLLSGNAVLKALRERGVDAYLFDPAERSLRAGPGALCAGIHCVARPLRRGRHRAGRAETMRIPYTGSGVMASALAMDKWRTKLVWLASGIPTPRYRVVDAQTDWMKLVAELGLPLIVKPAREGSTIGISKVTTVDHGEMWLAYEVAARHDKLVLVEEFVSGVELTASIVNGRALPLIRIEAPQGNYDYHNKYFRRDEVLLSERPPRREGAGDPRARSRRLRRRRLQRLGPAGPDPARRRHVLVPRGEHVARHDRTQPRADGGEAGGNVVPELCVEILRGAHVG